MRQVIEWKAPARFDDVLEVSMWTSRIGTTSFTLSAEMRRAGEADVLATIETTYVHVDHKTFTKREIEPRMRAALEAGAAGKTVDHAGLSAVTVIPDFAAAQYPGPQRSDRLRGHWRPGTLRRPG